MLRGLQWVAAFYGVGIAAVAAVGWVYDHLGAGRRVEVEDDC